MVIETNSTPEEPNDPHGGGGGSRPPIAIIGGLVAVVVIGIVLVVVAMGGGSDNKGSGNGADTQPLHAGLKTEADQPTPEATIDLTRPTPTAIVDQNITSVGAGDRFVISKFGVNAPLSYKVVGPDGQMPNPDGPDDVAYYNFSAWPGKGGAPGKGGNAVFAGHVDSGSKACKGGTKPPPCEAVLWDLNQLKVGDEIEVQLSGVSYKYSVTSNQPVSANNAPWDTIVGTTANESITIITCGGDFNRDTHEYNNRQVVTAVTKKG
jgi:LPXTG-site transpeptidase (sortase) family protein